MSERGDFLRSLVLAVAPVVAPVLLERVLKRESARRDVKPENVEVESFRAYVEARRP